MLQEQIFTLVILIILSACFSGIETALMSLTRIKVNALLRQKKRGADALSRIKQNHHKLLITILIGNNLVNIGAASLATIVFTNLFGSSGVGISIGIMTLLILIFGEITPKTFAAHNAEKLSLLVARPIEILSMILFPIIAIFEAISRFMNTLLGSKEGERELSEAELQSIVTMGHEEGILSREAAHMMQNIIDFEDTKVAEIMTQKGDVVFIDGKKKVNDVLSLIIKTPFSKYPVFNKNNDDVIGMIDIDDVLKSIKKKKLNTKVKSIIRETYFVPDTKEIGELLTEFDKKKIQMAIVVDEYGSVDGLVTLKDILEEIVGNIFDKSKRGSVYIKNISPKISQVNAKISVEQINRILHLGLKSGQFNTLAGFIQHKLQKIPKKGEKIILDKVTIEVTKVTNRSIKSVKIIKN